MRGRETKKHTKGENAQYMTRTQVLKKLQITLKDFRRLCILKGIFPRDPKKKIKGHDKTYYHKKDIQFLAHEPVLNKFREFKAYLKRFTKAKGRGNKFEINRIKSQRPTYKLDHLVKERYPTFIDAIRDLDDPLTMIHLFSSLPSNLIRTKRDEIPQLCTRLSKEWQQYIVQSHSLYKVFVSIKGIYYQALVQSQPVTWIVPHELNQTIPNDVDFRIMSTFLEFYTTMLKFINFKLYNDMNFNYPPNIDLKEENKGEGLNSMIIESKLGENEMDIDAAAADDDDENPNNIQVQEQIQAKVDAVIEGLKTDGNQLNETNAQNNNNNNNNNNVVVDDDMNNNNDVEDEIENDMAVFSKLDGTTNNDENNDENTKISPEQQDLERIRKLFVGLTFFLNREVAQNSLEFVLLCGGAKVVRHTIHNSKTQQNNTSITHHVMDRPKVVNPINDRIYIQPQWVFDSFNARALLPTEPYTVGMIPPPHLSPFIDDYTEGYVPKQRKILESWGAKPLYSKSTNNDTNNIDNEMNNDKINEEDEEVQYQEELAKERQGISFSALNNDSSSSDDDNDDDDNNNSSDDDNNEEEDSDDDDYDDGRMKNDKEIDEEKKLRMIMMSKKDSRLYSRMKYGINKKAEANEELRKRRKALEKKRKRDQDNDQSSDNKHKSPSKKQRKARKKTKS